MKELDRTWFDKLYPLMEEAFPYEERRDKEEQAALFQNPYYHVYGILQEKKIIAFLAAWELPSLRFVEHLATDAAQRGSGIGKALLQEYVDQSDLPVILEVEHPDTKLAERRIHFYERLGFNLYSDLPYVQPSFHNDAPLPLHLMSYPKRYDTKTMRMFHQELYEIVYGVHALCF